MNKLFAIIISAAAVSTLYSATTMAADPDLVLGYHFDNESDDTIQNCGLVSLDAKLAKFSLGGKFVKSPMPSDMGKVGKALEFDGESMLKIGPHSLLNSIKKYTLMAWVWYTWDGYPDLPLKEGRRQIKEKRQEIMEKYGAFWMNIRRDTDPKGLLRVGFPISECAEDKYNIGCWDSSIEILENDWTYVAATFDFESKSVEIYINGKKDENVKKKFDLPNRPCPSIHPLLIGGRHAEGCDPCPDAFFKGKIDEVRIYSKALTSDTIEELMSAEKMCDSRTKPRQVPVVPKGFQYIK
jgi:hypothetical protein